MSIDQTNIFGWKWNQIANLTSHRHIDSIILRFLLFPSSFVLHFWILWCESFTSEMPNVKNARGKKEEYFSYWRVITAAIQRFNCKWSRKLMYCNQFFEHGDLLCSVVPMAVAVCCYCCFCCDFFILLSVPSTFVLMPRIWWCSSLSSSSSYFARMFFFHSLLPAGQWNCMVCWR